MKFISLVIDLFLPADCKVCKGPLEYNESYICNRCLSRIEQIQPPFCNRCGKPCKTTFCSECQKKRRYFKRAREYGVFEGVLKEAIHIFKYEKKEGISNALGDLMCRTLDNLSWNVDYIVPVPLHKKKERERGFNQTRLLAEFIKRKRNIPLFDGLIKKINTPSQVGLSYEERRKNLVDSFSLRNKEKIKDKSILLIDDVMTTGTTVDECSKILMEGGAKDVFVLCLACTI